MFIDTHKQNLQGERTAKARHIKRGISGIALALALSSPAWGQTTPDDPECTLNGDVVTCEGDMNTGFRSPNRTDINTFNIRNLTTPINTTGTGIDILSRNAEPLVISIDDSVTINADNTGTAVGTVRGINVDNNGSDVTLTTAADVNLISVGVDSRGPRPDAISVTNFGQFQAGDSWNTTITNSGDLSVDVTPFTSSAGEFVFQGRGIDVRTGSTTGTTTITNSGDITINSAWGDGIYVDTNFEAPVIINNSGDIDLSAITLNSGGQFSRGIYANGSYIDVTNTGVIDAGSADGIWLRGDTVSVTNIGDINAARSAINISNNTSAADDGVLNAAVDISDSAIIGDIRILANEDSVGHSVDVNIANSVLTGETPITIGSAVGFDIDRGYENINLELRDVDITYGFQAIRVEAITDFRTVGNALQPGDFNFLLENVTLTSTGDASSAAEILVYAPGGSTVSFNLTNVNVTTASSEGVRFVAAIGGPDNIPTPVDINVNVTDYTFLGTADQFSGGIALDIGFGATCGFVISGNHDCADIWADVAFIDIGTLNINLENIDIITAERGLNITGGAGPRLPGYQFTGGGDAFDPISQDATVNINNLNIETTADNAVFFGYGLDENRPIVMTHSRNIIATHETSTNQLSINSNALGSFSSLDLTNTGLIRGYNGIDFFPGDLEGDHDGSFIGGETGSPAFLHLRNSGTISGLEIPEYFHPGYSIRLSDGNDIIINQDGGRLIGRVRLGGNDDIFTGEAGSFLQGDRAESVSRDVTPPASDNRIIAVNADSGDDTLTFAHNTFSGDLLLADGDDTLNLSGLNTFEALEGGAGTDTLNFVNAVGDDFTLDFGTLANPAFIIDGFEIFNQTGPGRLTFTGAYDWATDYNLNGGTLIVDAAMNGLAPIVAAGATLGGTGSLGAARVESGGTLSAGGTDIGTFNLASLVLEDGAILRFDLGAPDVVGGTANDLIEVAGDLTLDGTLDIFSTPDFGDGLYRLFNYGGALTDNGLDIGMAPDGTYEVETGVAGQVNLMVGVVDLQFWDASGFEDGTISGGTGVWTVPATNWTNSDGTENGDFSGAFAIFMGDAGTVTVEGTQEVTGMQFATDGYNLVAGAGGAVSLNDTESFIRVDPGVTATLDVPLVGGGRLVKRDTGTLVLSGANTHAGGTEVREGVIEITNDDNLGAAGSAFIFGGGTLRAGGALTLAREMNVAALDGTLDDNGNAITLSGMLTGGGTLTKTGRGALTLTGDSSAFAGDFMLSSGSLQLDGMLGGLLNVGAGSTLSGIGTAGNLDISGTLAVGSSIGTLTTTGDVTFRMGSDFQVELAADGTNDLLSVGGAATIEGGTLSIFTLDPETVYTDGQSYTVLTAAGGLTGQFSQLVETSVFLDFTADYQANDLVITLEKVLTFPEVANTFNQTQASTGLMELSQIMGSDSLAVYNALLILDGNSARNAFDLSSGEIYAGIAAADQRQARAQSDKLVSQAWRSGAKGLGAWGNVSVQDGSTDLDGNGADLDFDRQSIDLGIDYRGADNKWVAGVTAGWSDGDVTLAARNSIADTDSWQMGAYGRVGSGRAGPSAGAAINLSKSNADVARNIRFGGINRTATSSTDTDTTSLAAEGRYGKQIGTSNWVAGSVASVSYANTDLDEFAETGADALNLSGTAKTKASVYGAGLFANWQSEKGFLDASLQYGSGDLGRSQASLRLDGASNAPFLVRAAEHNNDRVIAKVSGALDLGNDWSLAANSRAEWASKDTSISAGITARKTF